MVDSKTIVFIHGLVQNPASWTAWKKYFEAKGYTCFTPAFPFHEGKPAELRKKPDPALGKLTLGQVVAYLADFIGKLPEKPVLIGHSMGGLAVQKLISQDNGVAGVCIDSAPPKGVLSFKGSFLRANLPMINPMKGNSVFLPSQKWLHHAFCNTMTPEQTQVVFNESVVPESRNITRSISGKDGYIDFKKPHKPLLFIAGSKDHIIPASLNKKNFRAYKDPHSKRDFREFEDRTHYTCGQDDWEEVAEYIAGWIDSLG